MADNFFKIQRGTSLSPQTAPPANPADGDIYYDSTQKTFVFYDNQAWINLASQIDVASATTLDSAQFTPAVVQNTLIRITGSTTSNLYGMTASTGGKQVVLYNVSSSTLEIHSNDSTEPTPANRFTTLNNNAVTITSGTAIMAVYDATQQRWTLTSGSGSGSGSGGSKNYLSVYTASTSSGIPNTGNGDFELGTAAGWSLAHTTLSSLFPASTGTAGVAFSSTNGGTGASGNLSFAATNVAPVLAGSFSGSLVSITASTAGDMLISDAFFIDTEDQAKVMTVKFYYDAVILGGLNFSGTSTNSFAIYVYDVTNAQWIQPAGVYGMTQNAGAGYCTATFQTTSNSTKYQLALVNVNASSGAYSLRVDDFFLGPQTAPLGAVITDWANAGTTVVSAITTPPTLGTATVTANNMWWRRVGSNMEIRLEFKQTAPGTATTGSGDYLFQIPTGYLIDTTKVTVFGGASIGINALVQTPNSVGVGIFVSGSSTGNGNVFVYDSTRVRLAATNASTVGGAGIVVCSSGASPFTDGSGGAFAMSFSVPIVGWSSNVQTSDSTDTRVVAARAYVASPVSTTSLTPINFDTVDFDTHGGVTTGVGVWKYTIPVTGYYNIAVTAYSTASTPFLVYKNGSSLASVGNAQTSQPSTGTTTVQLNAGDFIDARASGAYTPSAAPPSSVAQSNFISIERLSGPAVIAATESVNMIVNTAAGTASLTQNYIYTNKIKDTHNAYSTSTGKYTVPVSGTYSITGSGAGAFAPGGVTVRSNGTIEFTSAYTTQDSATVTGLWPFVAGDIIDIIPTSTVSTAPPGGITNAAVNYFMVSRVGN